MLLTSKLPLPLGPKKLPFVGHLFEFPANGQWESVGNGAGDTIPISSTLTSLGSNNRPVSERAVNELLEGNPPYIQIVINLRRWRRCALIYIYRARSPMISELIGWEYSLGIMTYGGRWLAYM
ncbi:hypothetical protein B0H12DRAFT_356255 [Mycena haematopus]|nr:hypothetical protein B0H12DRAFT_356255 [Mycena haematopus]